MSDIQMQRRDVRYSRRVQRALIQLVVTACALVAPVGTAVAQERVPPAETDVVEAFPRLELSVHGGPLYPWTSDSEAESRGVQLAFEPVLRINPYVGVGLSAQHARLGYTSTATSADAGDVYLTQLALVGRFTPVTESKWSPYAQLGVGVGEYLGVPECRSCSVFDVALLSAAVGVEYSVVPRLRLGLSVTAFLFGLGIGQAASDDADEGPRPEPPPWSQLGFAPRLSVTTVWGDEASLDAAVGEDARVAEDRSKENTPTYPRLDLSLHGGPLYPMRTASDVSSLGLQAALESVVRLNPYFGVGLGVQYAQLQFESTGTQEFAQGADAGSVYQTQASVIGRTTPFGESAWVPYFQVGIGVGEYVSIPKCACRVEDAVLLSAAGGVEYEVLRHLRFGLSVTAFLFGLGARSEFADPAPETDDASAIAPQELIPTWPKGGVAPRLSVTSVWD